MKIRLLLTFISLGLIACAPPPKKLPPPQEDKVLKEYEKTVTTPNPYSLDEGETTVTASNSLYSPYFNLYSDVKAYRKGDIVYIIVYESIDAIQKLATQTGQQHQVNNAVASFFGVHPKTLQNMGVNWQYQSGSKYSGTTQQSGVLSTRLAAYVKKVYPNGNLLIEASRYIYLNEAGHRIVLRGIVRPEDIGPDNSVPSSRIANLEIIYDGKGYMVDASSPGWFTRFLAKIWPF
ncbi:MAG: flagellar basal body L-ring protein FlgH [Gammaproteobacteria bacterium]|nr:MAG: flagellar basal body L-ring protein FlgH [Gammaproteobacteria bacterium]RTZ69865.1 MAG: flagellar basal body L-ring protein FlgH [Aquificaceae bacterium]